MDELVNIDRDQLIASAATYLIEGKDEEATSILLACRIDDFKILSDNWDNPPGLEIHLRGPRIAHDALVDINWQKPDEVGRRVQNAFEAVVPHRFGYVALRVRAAMVELDSDWRSGLIDRSQGRAIDNQALGDQEFRLWNNLKFRSGPEVKIAEALDRAKVLFFPLCIGRLNQGQVRANREPDFLVCQNGKWGILEVDGAPWHPPSRAAEDHDRDRLFKAHGMKVVEHFDSERCYKTPDIVVQRFLDILSRNG